jgi:hypothetical protein
MTLPFNPFRIDWNDCTFGQWEALLARCKRPTLLQTWQYGVAMAKVEGWKADFGIIHFEGKPVGLVLVQTRKWTPFLTTCRIHRGPLWIYDEIPGEMLKLVLGMIRQRYQLRRGQPLMFHPELPDNPATRQRMSATVFRRWSEGYESVWLDLTLGPDVLHAGLHGKWRNQLRQAERHNLVLETETSAGKQFEWLMEHYLEDKIARRYRGPSPAFLRAMHGASSDKLPLVVLRALHGGKPVAGVLLVRHGRAATYQVGWTDERGRAMRAHHFLLWQSVLWLVKHGYIGFDLGGINEKTPGIARFKTRMGGKPFRLVGGYV